MNSFTDENWPVFVKTDKTGLVRFCRFIKNRPVEFEILKKFEIKILKNQPSFEEFWSK
jgi:hypothetical protein